MHDLAQFFRGIPWPIGFLLAAAFPPLGLVAIVVILCDESTNDDGS